MRTLLTALLVAISFAGASWAKNPSSGRATLAGPAATKSRLDQAYHAELVEAARRRIAADDETGRWFQLNPLIDEHFTSSWHRDISVKLAEAIKLKQSIYLLQPENCTPSSEGLGVSGDFDRFGIASQAMKEARMRSAFERAGFSAADYDAVNAAAASKAKVSVAERPSPLGEEAARMNDMLFERTKARAISDIYIVQLSELCDFDELPVKIRTTPQFRRLSLIPEFFFNICARNNGNPWDRDRCPWWHDVVTEIVMLSGVYRYQVTWRSGPVKRGSFEVGQQDLRLDGDRGILRVSIRQ